MTASYAVWSETPLRSDGTATLFKRNTQASGENGLYSTNIYRTKTVSYTGLSGANKAWAYAVATNGKSDTRTVYY